jgi:hypothetical protein
MQAWKRGWLQAGWLPPQEGHDKCSVTEALNSVGTNRSVPYVAVSHPLVERRIGTISREYLDRMFFWNRVDLERKLEVFASYDNAFRVHQGLGGHTPEDAAGGAMSPSASLCNYSWQTRCNGLFELPIAA